jgi:hypothetical protein
MKIPVKYLGHPRLLSRIASVVALLACAAADGATAMKNPLYGDPSHPNISGMWNPEYAYFGVAPDDEAAPRPTGPPRMPPGPKLTPPYARRHAEWQKNYEVGTQEPDTVTRCLAFGMPRFGTMPLEIIQTPGQVTLNTNVLHDIRRIYLDGIGHTTGADPSFNGDSIGHWEGDTLVVETNNLRPGTLDRNGVPYSDKLTAVERIRRVSPTRLEIETTLTDPEAFLEPFTVKRAYVPMPPGSRFEEYICENNRDVPETEKQ